MFEHLSSLLRIGLYSAPASAQVHPATIPDHVECVEILTGGKIWFEADGVEREYGRGRVFWHLSGEKTIWKTTPDAPYRCIVFSFGVKQRLRSAPRVSCWTHGEDAAAFSELCLRQFHAGIDNPEVFLAYTYSNLVWNSTRQDAGAPWPAPLQAAIDYIRYHWREPLDVEDLAESCYVSRPYIFALFRKHLRTSPHQYLLKFRISRAKLMLANGDTAIKEIAISCGFGSLEVFYRQFRKAVATTPHEYRKSAMPYGFHPA